MFKHWKESNECEEWAAKADKLSDEVWKIKVVALSLKEKEMEAVEMPVSMQVVELTFEEWAVKADELSFTE